MDLNVIYWLITTFYLLKPDIKRLFIELIDINRLFIDW